MLGSVVSTFQSLFSAFLFIQSSFFNYLFFFVVSVEFRGLKL